MAIGDGSCWTAKAMAERKPADARLIKPSRKVWWRRAGNEIAGIALVVGGLSMIAWAAFGA
jgi:hypothetical protein